MEQFKYKPEIDGLRTFAVLAVIFYHINPLWVPSGFIGVDLFLVISGFLITNIIVKSNEKRNFSIVDFYLRRVKRIIPLTYFLLTAIMLAGWFLSYPISYRAESKSVLSALYFLANIRFARMSNYFVSENDNPLLHLWSLSLEEQFYFVWPLVIVLFYKLGVKKKLVLLTVVLTIFSVLLSSFFMSNEALRQYTYYLLPTRMTGLLVGVLLSVVNFSVNKKSNLLSFVGCMLLGLSIFFIDKDTFPSPSLLLPLLGCALIILTPSASFTKMFFANKLVCWIGKISFSLYMWHWPMLIFLNRYRDRYDLNIDYNNLNWLGLFLAALFLVSTLSYYFIETFFRNLELKKKYIFIFIFLLPLLVLTLLSYQVKNKKGLPVRYGLTENMIRAQTNGCYNNLKKKYCYLNEGDGESTGLLVIGDSHAGALSRFIKKVASDENLTVYSAFSDGCTFYLSKFKNRHCKHTKWMVKKVLKNEDVKFLVLVKRLDHLKKDDVNQLTEYIKEKTSAGYKVIFLKQVPRLSGKKYKDKNFINTYLSHKMKKQIGIESISRRYSKYNALIDKSLKNNKNVLLFDFSDTFCKDSKCRVLDDDGKPLYFDDDHLSAHGAEWLYEELKKNKTLERLTDFLN